MRGSEVSRGSLLEDQLLKRQNRDHPPKALLLRLKFFQAFNLVALQAAVLSPLSVIRNFRNTYRPDRLGHRSALCRKHFDLPKLRDDLFRLVSLPGHSELLHQAIKPYFREDHFSGVRPRLRH